MGWPRTPPVIAGSTATPASSRAGDDVRRRASLLAAIAALVSAVVVGGYPLLLSNSGLIVALAGLGLAGLVLGIATSFTSLSIVGVAVLVAEYLVALFLSGSSFDFLSAAYAVALLLLIELIDLANGWRVRTPVRAVVAERLRYLVTVVAVGATVAWLVAVAGTIVSSSLLLLVLGMLGAIAAIALPLHFARGVLASDEDS
jgi:hypothetical protein